ncbi:MAG: hypothetical protein HZB25_05250 [Candidatus Eisenbacteria bacterium]|nr:hypothetical protein [Candidatus Eisenbacteria bacterium]
MPTLQAALVDQLVEKNTFELLMTPEMADLLLQRPEARTAMDSLIARAARGVEPDSATAAVVLRRLKVDGLMYATQGANGPSVGIWSVKPRAAEVFRYQAGKATRGFLPESRHEGAQTKGAQYSTGGAQASGGGGAPSGASSSGGKSSGEPTAQMPTQYAREVTLMNTSESSDVRLGNLAEKIAAELHKILHPHSEVESGSQ